MKSLKDHIQEKKMDPVGKADADIDNDGDVDSSDKYLHNRRKAIKKAMKKEETGAWKKDSGWKKAKKPGTVTDKSGAKHTPMSRAKHLAKSAMKKEEVEQVDEVMSSPARAAHRGMFQAAAGKAQDQRSQKERLARLKKKGWVKNDRGGMSKVSEDMLDEDVTTALKKKSAKSGISVSTLRKVYNRGVAAWRTGHRPGTTPQQWGFARVNSFVTKSSGTWGKADKDLAAKVRGS